ncbi:YHS domain-containing (seleno)protein [uncultured Cohaesibacter sp.]|uniref:YHS domain-containing (seleno)protein n=1 Tax=uncultured Cohaesibacter sp. TaxID=1002546 RepID=UPI0029C7D2CB|nr:YHS domain-containing (seleno)protein [uncultured Cohaesibacter sp.]
MRILIMLLVLAFSVMGMNSQADATAQSRRVVTDSRSGYAIYGYDPVAYYTEHAAIPGLREHEYVWNGVSWLFKSRANKAVFMQNPDVYAPQYGGHGALAMARGYASDSNPNVWAIYRNRLFLFYSYTARAAWAEAVDLHVQRADEEWPKIEATLSR